MVSEEGGHVHMHTHAFKSTFLREPIDYSTKSALIGYLNEVH